MEPEQGRSIPLRVVENSKTAPNHGVRPELKSETKSRSPIITVVHDANLTVSVDSREQQLAGRQIECGPLVVHLHRRWRVLIPKSEVEREPRVHLPIVLNERSDFDGANSGPYEPSSSPGGQAWLNQHKMPPIR